MHVNWVITDRWYFSYITESFNDFHYWVIDSVVNCCLTWNAILSLNETLNYFIINNCFKVYDKKDVFFFNKLISVVYE